MGSATLGTQRQLRLCSSFAVVALFSLAVLLILAAFVALFSCFVFAALVVCATGAVLHVVVAELVIKHNNKEASIKTKKQRKQKKHYKAKNQKNRETKNIKTQKQNSR